MKVRCLNKVFGIAETWDFHLVEKLDLIPEFFDVAVLHSKNN